LHSQLVQSEAVLRNPKPVPVVGRSAAAPSRGKAPLSKSWTLVLCGSVLRRRHHVLVARASRNRSRSRYRVCLQAGEEGKAEEDKDDSDDDEFRLVDLLIKKSRNNSEIGICTQDWHPEIFDEVPEGYLQALDAGIDLVDVLANGTALKLLASAQPADVSPRYCVRVSPKPTLGLGLILNKKLVEHWTVLGPLQQTMGRLGVADVETLTLHSDGAGRLSFPFWVYDAVAQAYQRGLCTRVGVSHPNANAKSIQRVQEELLRRGVALSCVFTELSLLDLKSVQLVRDCRALGLQVFARNVLGVDELASGRFTAANPTGGEISVPRFTLAQLMPLRPLHDALGDVARLARQRCEKPEIDSTQVALQWVISKGASPICDVTTESIARAASGCSGWALTDQEVQRLDAAAEEVAKTRR